MSKRSRTLINLALEKRAHTANHAPRNLDHSLPSPAATSPARSLPLSDISYMQKHGYPWADSSPSGEPSALFPPSTPASTISSQNSSPPNKVTKKRKIFSSFPKSLHFKRQLLFQQALNQTSLKSQTEVSLPQVSDCQNSKAVKPVSEIVSLRKRKTGMFDTSVASTSAVVHAESIIQIENQTAERGEKVDHGEMLIAQETTLKSQTEVSSSPASDCENSSNAVNTASEIVISQTTKTGTLNNTAVATSSTIHDESIQHENQTTEERGRKVDHSEMLRPQQPTQKSLTEVSPSPTSDCQIFTEASKSCFEILSEEAGQTGMLNIAVASKSVVHDKSFQVGNETLEARDKEADHGEKDVNAEDHTPRFTPHGYPFLVIPSDCESSMDEKTKRDATQGVDNSSQQSSILTHPNINTLLSLDSNNNFEMAPNGETVSLPDDIPVILEIDGNEITQHLNGLQEDPIQVAAEQEEVVLQVADEIEIVVEEYPPPIMHDESEFQLLQLEPEEEIQQPEEEIQQPERKRVDREKAPPKGKKRTRCPEDWAKNQRKAALHAGQAYVTLKGKTLSAKVIKEPCSERCRLKCSSKISEEKRTRIHQDFYRTKDQESKWKYIRMCVKDHAPERPTLKHEFKRRSRVHSLPVDGEIIKVCQTMFLNTLVISDFMVKTALTRNLVSPEKRGGKKIECMIPDYVHKSIADHIASFPRVESHYCRAETSFEYLESSVKSVANMYRLYTEWIKDKSYGEKIATKRQYEEDFKNLHRINFFKPRKDLCDDCVQYDLNRDNFTEEQQQVYENHILKKDFANNLEKEDRSKYEKGKDATVVLAHFDLQKVLLLPHTNASGAYYSRKLSVFNFTIFDLSSGQGHCFTWDETVGNKGANEITSYVFGFIKKKAEEGKKTIIFWSDNCAAQNKNRYLYAMYLLASAQFGVTIIHRYLVKGHTQNAADGMHARIEAECKSKNLFVPEDWSKIMASAKVTGKPYEVNCISTAQIKDYHTIGDKYLTWPAGARWNDVSEAVVDHNNSPWAINVKYDLSDSEHTKISVKSKDAGRPVNLLTYSPKEACKGPLPITKLKKDDLLKLCEKGIVPRQHVAFYQNLKALQPGQKRANDFYAG